VSADGVHVDELPHALDDAEEMARRLGSRRPAVFLDYDGTLTPIVDRPEDAVISDGMRDAVRDLAKRCTVCVVSGRDRPVVQELMGVDDLVVAGSHGFDIWSPTEGTLEHDAGAGFEALVDRVAARLRDDVGSIEGVLLEPKKASVAVHYRLVAEDDRPRIHEAVERLLAEHPEELKVTPGKMVYELQPKLDWDKGKAVIYLIGALGLDGEDVVPLYLGDDITDEHAFEALAGRGIGIFVGNAEDPEVAGRPTAADFVLDSTEEVERFLGTLAC
jgi:trehalose 6-phosphate phosphatase